MALRVCDPQPWMKEDLHGPLVKHRNISPLIADHIGEIKKNTHRFLQGHGTVSGGDETPGDPWRRKNCTISTCGGSAHVKGHQRCKTIVKKCAMYSSLPGLQTARRAEFLVRQMSDFNIWLVVSTHLNKYESVGQSWSNNQTSSQVIPSQGRRT